jgi:lipopolysaccharide/colanic/teichoic acid biosynthesis glycosyltransferase
MEACPPGAPGDAQELSPLSNDLTAAVSRRDGRWKRAFDLVIGASATVALTPLLVTLALLVRLDSPGPAFFRQERIGKDGVPFRMWKFRSMHHNSNDQRHRVEASAWFAATPTGRGYKSLTDPRITNLGRFIRRTSLDELPQLFNVLTGEMSLVGPRPAIPYELEHYQSWYFERQHVKPGITGLWQVSGRETISAKEMMALDVRYVRERTPWLDFKVLFFTLPALFGRARADL